ncbi:MAG: family 16 glycosylhydrolase, partial [Planctomycetota bacterium]|nr:family 16 glycosylhydrolase [Planctomycetota bacterium]
SHKTGGGDFSGWRFSDNAGENNPFSQVGTWLRIRATKKPDTKGSTGIISSAHEDKSGFYAAAPCYFECRLVAQSAPGTWPAFWLLSGKDSKGRDDEIDVIEAYGGWGPKNPGSFAYRPTTHFWKQPLPDWAQKGPDGKTPHPLNAKVEMTGLGGKSAWSTTFHTYAVLITEADTAYYLDDLEVLRHPSGEISKTQPFFFMVNYSIGGISGWQIDLGRYGNQSDMWVDYVRVYQGEKK